MPAICAICEEPITRTDVFGLIRCYVAHRACIRAGGTVKAEDRLRRALAAAESATSGLREAAALSKEAVVATRTARAEVERAQSDLALVRGQRVADQRTHATECDRHRDQVADLERALAAERALRHEAELKAALGPPTAVVDPAPQVVTPERDATEQRFALLELD